MSEKIAFIGVGNMGNPMAVNLLKAGNKIKVFDVSASRSCPYSNWFRISEFGLVIDIYL